MNRIKRIIPVILITVVLAGILAACGSRRENSGTKQEDEMKGEYHKITGDDIIILDVRTQDEYEESHIPGAILIPNETIGTEMPEQLPDADQEILVYCRSGNRSKQASQALVDLGYTNVVEFGGINSWPYEVE